MWVVRSPVRGVVRTAAVGTLGGVPPGGRGGTDETPDSLADTAGDSKRGKLLVEAEARGFARQGLAVAIINWTAPVWRASQAVSDPPAWGVERCPVCVRG